MSIAAHAFCYVSHLVRRESAIVLEPGKEYLVEARLSPLARDAGASDVTAYVDELERAGTSADRTAAVEALTTNETYWFRDQEHFDVLAREVLPGLMPADSASRHLRVWSAGCSSGQEAYSVAMILLDGVLPHGWTAEILATDLSRGMLERAARGRYSELEVRRGLPPAMLARHFQKVGAEWQVSDRLRAMVTVRHLNLAAPFPVLPTFDLVLLRNVLIYFDGPAKAQVLRRVLRVTAPGGVLLLGAAETALGVDDGWQRHQCGRVALHRRPGCVARDPGPAQTAETDTAPPTDAVKTGR